MSTVIEGFVPAVVTPFDANGDLLAEDFEALVEWHLAQGADAICLAGDNGEAWTLPAEDRRRIAETTVRVVAGRVPIVMGASTTTAKQSIAYAEIAAEAGCDALMIGPQSYVGKTTTKELVDRFTAIHAAVPLPVLVYNSPRRTGLNLDSALLGAVCDAVPVIGLKEASRDVFHMTEILRDFSDRIAVLVGPCPFILWGIGMGARGFVSSGPELFGSLAARLMEIGRAAPNEEYQRTHYDLTLIYQTLMGTGTWPSALKAALNLVGAPAGLPREPVQPLAGADLEKLTEVLESLGLLDGAAARVA
jgi:4-hydroxy-tetrahydrodipicolinate synthase